MAATKVSRLANTIINALEKRYGKKPGIPSWNFLDTIIYYIVYHSSGVTAARRALKAFRNEYIDYNELRISSLVEIRNTLKNAKTNENVAFHLRSILKDIYKLGNTVSLDHLEELPASEIKSYLATIESLPIHAADFILSTKCEQLVIPVDENIARLAFRLKISARQEPLTRVQNALMRNISKNRYFNFFLLAMEHATKVCLEEPRCDKCVLLKKCEYGKKLSKKTK